MSERYELSRSCGCGASRVVEKRETPSPVGLRGGEALQVSSEHHPQRGENRTAAAAHSSWESRCPVFSMRRARKWSTLSHLPALNGVPLKGELRKRLRIPVFLDTDTNAGAVAESFLGAGAGFDRVLYISMGTGLGAALVVDGKPVRVSGHSIGHIAHVPLGHSGPRCACGQHGCAESLLSAKGVLWLARRSGLPRPGSTEALWRLACPQNGDARAAQRNRPGRTQPERLRAARSVWRSVGKLTGQLSCTLGTLFLPDVTVVGGGTAGAASLFLPAAEKTLRQRWPPPLGPPPTLCPAAMGRFAGAVGAALLARSA